MPEPQRSHYEVPVITYPTPSWGDAPVDGIAVIDELIFEYVEPNKPGYVKMAEGAAHPNTRDFPNHRLLKEEFVDQGTNRRVWCNGYRNQDQYNYDIAYSGESNSHPIFTRRYLERRDQYSVYAKESKFTGIYLIRVTNEGSGYTSEPTVTITGNATARAIISSDGKVKWIYLTSEGSGYTSAPTVTISGGGGAAATATALLHLDTKVVYEITVTAGGTGYTSEPTVTIAAPPSGVTATAVAQISGGAVVAITVTSYGSGYVTAPTVTISGGGGANATATSTLETATMRLVKEDVTQFPEDDPRRSLYVMVTRQYETLPGPVLIQHDYEPFIDTFTSSLKRVVLASTVPADMSYVTQAEGTITEYQPLSKYRSIQIVSKINPNIAWENGGDDQIYYGTVNYSFPDEIQENPSISVYFAYDGSANLVIDFGWVCNLKEGYSGPCRAKFLRRHTFDPDDAGFVDALPTVTFIQPESDVINNGFVYVGGNLIARATQFVVPKSLHPALDIDVTGTSPPVTNLPGPVTSLPATVPESLPAGTEVVVSVKPQLWRFRLWVYDIVSVFVPTPP